MTRVAIAVLLFAMFVVFSALVYTKGTDSPILLPAIDTQIAAEGKRLYQKHNCQACHQIFGLGGYLGPELTTAFSDKHRGEVYIKAMLLSGGKRMPRYELTQNEINAITAFLKYVDSTARPNINGAY